MNDESGVQISDPRLVTRSVVLASPDAALRQRLSDRLTDMRWIVKQAAGAVEAMAQVDLNRPEALLIDSWLPDLEVGEFAAHVTSRYPSMDVLRLDGSVSNDLTGAKSPRRNELFHALRQAQEDAPTGAAVAAVQPDLQPQASTSKSKRRTAEALPEMIGDSALMLEMARMVRLVAPRSATVLIEGETGTGKELVAKAINRLSTRSAKSFTVLNCAAIPESLLEAELFGHTRGAFTGAVQSRTGRIEAAHGGTLFLDEIGEMPLSLQAKMLRFLECGELQRVGDNETIRVDVRVIAATHQHLHERSADGSFRLDLYHRLAVFPIEVPALRQRMDDLPRLVDFFLNSLAREMSRKTISSSAMAKLFAHDGPGNVRELKHVLERGAIMTGEECEITADDLTWRSRDNATSREI